MLKPVRMVKKKLNVDREVIADRGRQFDTQHRVQSVKKKWVEIYLLIVGGRVTFHKCYWFQ